MAREGCDEIAVVEAMYELTSTRASWLTSVSRALASNLRAELGGLVALAPREGSVEHFLVDAPPELAEGAQVAVAPFARHEVTMLSMLPPGDGGLKGLVETFSASDAYRRVTEPFLRRAGARDTLAFFVRLSPAAMIGFSSVHARDSTPTAITKRRYATLAKHFKTAWRLREQLGERGYAGSVVAEAADAVLDPSGFCLHAVGAARHSVALQALRAAVIAREHARGRQVRAQPETALAIWPALIAGHWSLVDHVELDGRRLVLAIRNCGDFENPRALTVREQQVVSLAAQGASNGEIAHERGISEGGVAAHLHAALRKLKCRSRTDLIRVARAEHEQWLLSSDPGAVGVVAEPMTDPVDTEFPMLSPAENAVLKLIRAGQGNQQIAALRRTSERTVANQVASILRKTKRHSRYELVAAAAP